MIVLDASAALDWLLQTSVGQRIEQRIYSARESLHAPHLLDLEVTQVLWRLARAGTISARRANEAIQNLLDLGPRGDHRGVLSQALSFAAFVEGKHHGLQQIAPSPTCKGKPGEIQAPLARARAQPLSLSYMGWRDTNWPISQRSL